MGTETSLLYARDEPAAFATASTVNPAELVEIDARPFDLALSVMDPYIAVWAHVNSIPCVYVDSLYWFWDWSNSERSSNAARTILSARPSLLADALSALAELDMSTAEYVGHAAASVSCVQRTPSTPVDPGRGGVGWQVIEVAAIVDLSRKSANQPIDWTASFGGLLNPLVRGGDALAWARATIRLMTEAFAAAGIADAVTVTGNTKVMSQLELTPPYCWRARRSGAVLDLLNRSRTCLTPPGLTTMLESLAYGCPIVALPAQHYGHSRIYQDFSNANSWAFPRLSSFGTGPGGGAADATANTQAVIHGLLHSSEVHDVKWQEAVAGTASALSRIADDREAVLSAQLLAVTKHVGGFSGVEQVLGVIENLSGLSGLSGGR